MRPLRRRDLYWKGSATGQRSRVMSDVYDSSAMPAKPTLYAGADIRRVWYLSEQHRNWCKYFQTELEQIVLRNIANDHNQGRSVMLSRRTVLDVLACSALVTAAGAEPAKKKQESAKKHQHKNGHNLLGAKLKQNGRHQIDKAGQASVSADVNNSKVTAMSANHPQKGNLPARKVKSRQNMAGMEPQLVRVAANAEGAQLAQAIVYTPTPGVSTMGSTCTAIGTRQTW